MTQALELHEVTFDLPLSGAATVPWRYMAAGDHICAFLNGAGAVVGMTYPGTGFTITPEGNTLAGTGVLTLLNPPPASAIAVRLTRITPPVQLYAATPGAEGVERQLDRMSLVLQEHGRDIAQTPRVQRNLTETQPLPDSVYTLDANLNFTLRPIDSFLKGDPGSYAGLNLIGTSLDPAGLPETAEDGQAWGVIADGLLTIYLWFDGQWTSAGPITTAYDFPVANIIHVQEAGSDANSGASWGTAVRHIEQALELAAARDGQPTLIEVAPMTIITQGHLDVPDNTVVKSSHRTVFIRPDTGFEERNVFRLGSGSFLEGFMFENWRLNDMETPTEGFAVSFRPGAVILRVPYAHKIAVRSARTWGLVPPPLDRENGNPLVPRGAGVVLADGLVCSPYSAAPNIMTWGATPVTPNGIGYLARNGALINAVNAVSMWSHRHFVAQTGGQIILSACSTQFGDYTLAADGTRNVVVPAPAGTALTVQADAAALIEAAKTAIIDAMWADLVGAGLTTGWTADMEAFTRADAAQWLQSVIWVLQSANGDPAENFAAGLFNRIGERVFDIGLLPAFTRSLFNTMRDQIIALGIAAPAQVIVAALTSALNSTLTSPEFRQEPSRITAIGHTWTANMAGVALPPSQLPTPKVRRPIRDSIRQTNGGVVIATGQDDFGFTLLSSGPTGVLEVSPQKGLQGNQFTRPVRRISRKYAIMGSF